MATAQNTKRKTSAVKARLTPSWKLLPASWQRFQAYISEVLLVAILPSLTYTAGILLITSGLHVTADQSVNFQGFFASGTVKLGLVLTIVGILWTFISWPAWLLLQLDAARGRRQTVGDYYRGGFQRLWRIVGVYFCIALFVFFGLILFIVPGLIFFKRYFLAPYYIADRDISVREALRQSAADSKGYGVYIWGVVAVMAVINIASSIIGAVPILGQIVSALASYIYGFAPALRYVEVSKYKAQDFTFDW